MSEIICQYRVLQGTQPVCRIVADLTGRPLGDCHVNDSACTHCLKCGVAPQGPNVVTASMSIGVALRSGAPEFVARMKQRMSPYLTVTPPPQTACIFRGPEVRQVACKPCQAGSLIPVMVPAYRCPKHSECTLFNTGAFPKIKACSTCEDRLEQAYPLEANPAPAEVQQAIAAKKTPSPPVTRNEK